MSKELCRECGEPIGRAGLGEDSLYIDAPFESLGPYCESCYQIALEDVCGLCSEGGADKIHHPHYWPGEQRPDTNLVHAACEDAECAKAHAALTPEQREATLRRIAKAD